MWRALLPLLLQVVACDGDSSYRSPTSGETVDVWDGAGGPGALHNEYGRIFQHGNRNAASHLWTTFLFERARFMPKKRFLTLAGSYCAVSGSPVDPGDHTRYRMRLPHVDGSGKVTGFMYFCCWPCVCDSQDFIRVDTKTIRTADGPQTMRVAVIGNPCDDATALAKPWTDPFSKRTTTLHASAEEVRCRKSGKLIGATLSDHGYPIISVFFSAPSSFEETSAYKRAHNFEDEREFASMCDDRKDQGYNSGMGEIFRRVAAIAPVKVGERGVFRAPRTMKSTAELRAEAARRGLAKQASHAQEKSELVRLLEETQAAALAKAGTKQLRTVAQRRGIAVEATTEKEQLVAALNLAMTGRGR